MELIQNLLLNVWGIVFSAALATVLTRDKGAGLVTGVILTLVSFWCWVLYGIVQLIGRFL